MYDCIVAIDRRAVEYMAMTAVDIDDQVLDRARAILGTRTKKDTINAALREVVRRQAAADLVELLKSDAIEIRDHRELHRMNWHDHADQVGDA
jgi:Arc/MetJ family transcription regulator